MARLTGKPKVSVTVKNSINLHSSKPVPAAGKKSVQINRSRDTTMKLFAPGQFSGNTESATTTMFKSNANQAQVYKSRNNNLVVQKSKGRSSQEVREDHRKKLSLPKRGLTVMHKLSLVNQNVSPIFTSGEAIGGTVY